MLKVFTPSVFMDFGTPRKIDIYAYSYETNATIPLGSITVVTQGIYISPLTLIIIIPIIIILLIIYLLYRYLERKEQEESGKPVKPWLIPEEKKYLQELKKKDHKEYHKTISMMRQEYQSALLWYKSSIKRKTERTFPPLFTKTERKEKTKIPEEKNLELEEKPTTETLKEDKKWRRLGTYAI